MARVPVRQGPQETLRPLSPAFASTSSRDIPADAFGAGAARGLQEAGQGLQALGADLGDEALRMAIERNEAAAREADADLSARVREALYGENGYYRLSGRDAVFGAEAAQQQLRAAVDEIAAGLPTDRARELLQPAADQQLNVALGAIDRHAISEHRTYANNAAVARYESALLDVDQAADLVGAAERGMEMALVITDEQAERLGWSQAQRDQILRERQAEVGTRYSTRLAHTDPARALRELGIPNTTAVPLTRSEGTPVSSDTIVIPPQTGAWGDRHADEALAVGVNPNVMFAIAGSETRFQNIDTQIVDPETGEPASDATGPWQFISSTWNNLIAQHHELGLTAADRRDPEAQAIMAAHAAAGITRAMERALGRPIDGLDLYLAWFVGEGNAARMIRAGEFARAADIIPEHWLTVHNLSADATVGDVRAALNSRTNLAGVPVRWGDDARPPAAHRIPSAAPANRFVAAMSYEQRAQAARIAERQLDAAMAGERAELAERALDDRAAYLSGRQPPNPRTEADFIRVWGPEEGPRRWAPVEQDREIGHHVSTMFGMPPDRREDYVEGLRPPPGPGFAEGMETADAVEAELVRRRAENAAILQPILENEINMLEAGVIPPPESRVTRAQMFGAMTDDEAEAAWAQLQALREAEGQISLLPGSTPERRAAILDSLRPTPGPDFTDQAVRWQRGQEANQRINQAIADDPAGYVSSYDTFVRHGYEMAQTPDDMRLAMQASWAAQAEAGIPVEQRRPLTAAAVQWIGAQWAGASGAERVALLHSVTADLGDPLMFRAALQQITEDANIPTGAAIVVASMDRPGQRSGANLLAEISGTSTADLRNLIGTGEGGETRPVNDAVAGNENLANFAASLALSTFAGDDPLSVVVTEQTQRLAYYLVSRGATPQDAVDQAVDQIIGQAYAFGEINSGTFRVPTAADAPAVIAGATAVVQRPDILAAHVGTLSLVSINPELQDERGQAIVQAQGRRNIQTQSQWITSPDERGLMLMWQDGNAVQRDDGTHVLLTWSDLAAIGNENPAPQGLPPSVVSPLMRGVFSGGP